MADPLGDPPDSSTLNPSSPRRAGWLTFAAVCRWLHIYLSLLGFTALLFFAVTGLTLNHPQWFGGNQQSTVTVNGTLPLKWLQPPETQSPSSRKGNTPERQVLDKLAIVEHLRSTHHLRGSVTEFRVDEQECTVLLKAPAYSADVLINRTTGTYEATVTTLGVTALINDLHKGRDTSLIWSLLIDVSAVLMIVVSVTGFLLIFFLRRRRFSGLFTALVGTIVLILIAVLSMR